MIPKHQTTLAPRYRKNADAQDENWAECDGNDCHDVCLGVEC